MTLGLESSARKKNASVLARRLLTLASRLTHLQKSRRIISISSIRLHVQKELSKLEDLEDVQRYAKVNFKLRGSGDARDVYIINSNTVIKIAKNLGKGNLNGIAQNKAEAKVYNLANNIDILAKIYASDTKGYWLLSELAKPVKEYEFKRISGYPLRDYLGAISMLNLLGTLKKVKTESSPKNFEILTSAIGEKLVALKAATNVDFGEILNASAAEQWGVNSSGDLVIVDYGV